MEEEKKSTLAEDMKSAEIEYRAQFDPQSASYHHGNPMPVPIGGQNIPASMCGGGMYPDQPAEEKPPGYYGPKFEQLTNLRAEVTNLKKALSGITPPLEGILRHKEVYNRKGNKENPAHLEKMKNNIAAEETKLNTNLADANKLLGVIAKIRPEYGDKYWDLLKEVTEEAIKMTNVQTKEELTDYQFKVKSLSALVFNETKKLLQEIKEYKKSVDEDNAKKEGEEVKEEVKEEAKEETKEEIPTPQVVNGKEEAKE